MVQADKEPQWLGLVDKPVVDARDFDVDLSGTNDSVSGLQAAVDQAKGGAGTLLIPSGTYRINGELSIDDALIVMAIGGATIVSHHTGTALKIAAGSVYIDGRLKIERNGGSGDTPVDGVGIEIANTAYSSSIHLRGVNVQWFEDGILIGSGGAANGTGSITACQVMHNNYAIRGDAAASTHLHAFSIRSNALRNNVSGGLAGLVLRTGVIGSNVFEDQPNPVVIEDAEYVTFEPNWFESNAGGDGYGIWIKGGHVNRIEAQHTHSSTVDKSLVRLGCGDTDCHQSCEIIQPAHNIRIVEQGQSPAQVADHTTRFAGILDASHLIPPSSADIETRKAHTPFEDVNAVAVPWRPGAGASAVSVRQASGTTGLSTNGRFYLPTGVTGRIGVCTIPFRPLGEATANNGVLYVEVQDEFGVAIEDAFDDSILNRLNQDLTQQHVGRWLYVCFAHVLPADAARFNVQFKMDGDSTAEYQIGHATVYEIDDARLIRPYVGPLAERRVIEISSSQTVYQPVVLADSSGGALTVTLATDMLKFREPVIVKDAAGPGGTNNITIDTEGSATIDGASSVTITSNYEAVRLISDGSNWFTI